MLLLNDFVFEDEDRGLMPKGFGAAGGKSRVVDFLNVVVVVVAVVVDADTDVERGAKEEFSDDFCWLLDRLPIEGILSLCRCLLSLLSKVRSRVCSEAEIAG